MSLAAATGLFPDEVVTRAVERDVALPHGAGTAALVTLDNGHDHTRPNTFGPAGLAELDRALDGIEARDDVAAICLTGKPFILAAGADTKGMARVGDREQVRTLVAEGNRVFRRLGEARVPSFAFVNGLALGGGLEIALHCTYRTVSRSAAALGLPECMIGLVPAWGGAWLLPNLVGAQRAVQVIVENPLDNGRTLPGGQAHELGLADAVFDAADFLEQSLTWAAGVVRGDIEVRRPDVDRSPDVWATAVARGRAAADAKVHGAAPAPYAALDLVAKARTQGKDEALAEQAEVLADLLMGEESRASLYAFDLVQRRAKRPAGAPDRALARPVTKVGIVGAGLMATQLAALFVRRLQVPVVLTDLDEERVSRGVAAVHAEVDRLLARRRVTADTANRLKALVTGATDKAAFADADLVVEAVFEEMKVKRQVFAEVEAVVSADCVLATNTSALSVTEMAAGLVHPERVVGLHFFNPVAVLPLVEVVRAERTDDGALATAFDVARRLKKSAVLVKDAPGFVVNRILTRFLGEITRAVDEGTPAEVADGALAPLGLPMTPFVLLQLVGPGVALHVAETLTEAFPQRFGVSENLRRLVAAGRSAVWSWDADGHPYLDDETRALLEQGTTPLSAEQVRERAVSAIAEEVRLLVDEGVVAEPQDVDLCLLLGAGWPFHLGGITPYLDRAGVSERVTGRRFLPPGVASVPRPG
jgi:3-hydroxyacyl-CoA dehydrogenase/enoyl-CoA hydratase/carnithine racemase